MEFDAGNLLKPGGIFLIAVSVFLSLIFFFELRRYRFLSFLFFVAFVPLSVFVVLKDERGSIIKEVREDIESGKKERVIAGLYRMAEIQQYEGDLRGLIKTYMEIVRMNPDDDVALTQLAFLLLHTGNVELAIPLVERAISINPENKDAKMLKRMIDKFLEERKKMMERTLPQGEPEKK